MAQMNVTDDAKAEFRQKKKELADAKGLGISQVSDTDTIIWLCESQPTSKGDRLRILFEKFRQDILIIAGPLRDDKPLNELLELMRVILRCSYEDQDKMVAYAEELKGAIDRVAAKYPSKILAMKKRPTDETHE